MADGTASGRLIVPPNQVLEEEPNQTVDQAQRVEASWLVTGSASETDPGFSLPGFPEVEVEDLYRVTASERIQVALMLAVNPDLTPADIDQLLAGTHPDTEVRITQDLGAAGRDDIYGHGLIDAAQAVVAARSVPGGGGAPPSGSILAVSTNLLNFENFLDRLSFKITNAGIETLRVTSITDDASWLTLSPRSGTAPLTVEATVDRTGLSGGGMDSDDPGDFECDPGDARRYPPGRDAGRRKNHGRRRGGIRPPAQAHIV